MPGWTQDRSCSQRAIPIAPDETGQSLHDKLAELGGDLLIDTLPGYLDGAIQPQPQDDALVTLAPRIQKEEGHVDWTQSAAQIERTVRAFTPWPGTFTFWNDQQLKILSGHVIDGSAAPGQVVRVERRRGDWHGRAAFRAGSPPA